MTPCASSFASSSRPRCARRRAWLIDGIRFDGPTAAGTSPGEVRPLLLVALILGLINSFVRPILTFLSIPFIIVTLGLFLLVINAGMLLLTDGSPTLLDIGFHVTGSGPPWAARS